MFSIYTKTNTNISILGSLAGIMQCRGCGKTLGIRVRLPICRTCYRALKRLKAADPVLDSHRFRFSRKLPAGLRVLCPYAYTGITRHLMHGFKIGGDNRSVSILKASACKWLKANMSLLSEAECIVPVPSHQKIWNRQRGASSVIANWIASETKLPVKHVLRRSRGMKKQTSLSRYDRISNPKGQWKLFKASKIKGKKILIVDDVITTGATMAYCSQTLRESGAGKTLCFALSGGGVR